MPVTFDPPGDALFRNARLAHDDELPVLGRRVHFETNSPTVLEAVDRSFGRWRRLAQCSADPAPTCRVRVFVEDGEEGPATRSTPRYRMPEPGRLVLATEGSVGVAETDRHEAYAFVTTALVADDMRFRYGVVEALTLMLVTSTDRHPVHAASVVSDGTALLLAGPSGVGKSTLAYAASRAGLDVRGDEAAYVQRRPELRIWGMAGRVRLSPAAAAHFPELREVVPAPSVNGKLKVVTDIQVGDASLSPVERGAVCLLTRGSGPPELQRLGPPEVFDALTSGVESGFDLDMEAGREVAELLARNGGWRLCLSKDPCDAVPLLEEVFAGLRRGSAPAASG